MNLKYLFFNKKGSKHNYYAARYLTFLIPNFIYHLRRRYLLSKFEKMPQSEKDYIMDRVNYYCKLDGVEPLRQDDMVHTLAQHKLKDKKTRGYASVYFFDTFEYTRSLPGHLKWAYIFGDVNFLSPLPAIVKSRPIDGENKNSVILKLNKLRHFISVDDKKSFEQKSKISVFRGVVGLGRKRGRMEFMQKFHNSDICDAGDVFPKGNRHKEWLKPKLTLEQQLDFKFIVALEGNDVASNLKWIMSSNSVAIMPRPLCETWFMEGRLIPNVHYVEVAEDFSNFEEKINYYLAHPDEAKEIAKNANKHWEQFRNREREDIISHLVLKKYFTKTGQEF